MSSAVGNCRGSRFAPIRWRDMSCKLNTEWLVKHLLPCEGIAAIYGKPGSYKSFIAFNLALSVALGESWAGRCTERSGVVYIAAEGANGLRKRRAGYLVARPDMPLDIRFGVVTVAPDLGTGNRDLDELAAAIAVSGITPGLIVIDTLARALGAGDENGSGMAMFVSNATRLAERFKCLVLVVHHSGLAADKRLRGHSSLHGALDAVILCERGAEDLSARLTLQKVKDDADGVRLAVTMTRIVVGHDTDGDEISTLIVEAIIPLMGERTVRPTKPKRIPKSQRLLLKCLEKEISDRGVTIQFKNGDPVRAVAARYVRNGYFAANAQQADPGEDEKNVIDRQRKSFGRAFDALVQSKMIMVTEFNQETFLWTP